MWTKSAQRHYSNTFMNYFFVLLLSTLTTLGLTPLMIRLAARLKLIDRPGGRKIHPAPVPRVGGLAMVLGIIPALFLYGGFDQLTAFLLAGAAVLVAFALADDTVGLGYKTKFLGQGLAALIVTMLAKLCAFSLLFPPNTINLPAWLSLPFTLLVILSVTNAINLADGLDGMAGGIMLQVFLCISLIAYGSGNTYITLLAVAVVGALFAFLRFNTHPAVIFMGDTGSQLLGFLGIVLTLGLLQNNSYLSPLLPLLLFGLPVLDTAVVMVERIRRGLSPFRADNNHLHHKLIRLGLSHSGAVLAVYIIQAFFVISAFSLRFSPPLTVLVFFMAGVLFILLPIYVCHECHFRIRSNVSTIMPNKSNGRPLSNSTFFLLRLGQKTLEYGLPAILLISAFLPARISPLLATSSWLLLGGALLAVYLGDHWPPGLIRITTFLFMPLIFIYCHAGMRSWADNTIFAWYSTLYILTGFAAALVHKLTRREQGFHFTPTDFLIFFLFLTVLNWSDPAIKDLDLDVWLTLLIVFFFSIEVLIGELRDKCTPLLTALLPGIAVVAVRGLF